MTKVDQFISRGKLVEVYIKRPLSASELRSKSIQDLQDRISALDVDKASKVFQGYLDDVNQYYK